MIISVECKYIKEPVKKMIPEKKEIKDIPERKDRMAEGRVEKINGCVCLIMSQGREGRVSRIEVGLLVFFRR